MGWKAAERSMRAAMRRQERAARERARRAQKAWKEAQKQAAKEAAQLEVEAFEALIEELTSIHRECIDDVDWPRLAKEAPPTQPTPETPDRKRSTRLRAELAAFKPGFFERLFGLTSRRLSIEAQLRRAIEAEKAEERRVEEENEAATQAWQEAMAAWEYSRDLARRVLEGNQEAFAEAVRSTECLEELMATLGQSKLQVTFDEDRAELTIQVDEKSVVPEQQKSLTAANKVSSKNMPVARRMEIYQDYVCGAALRAGREIMAVTPVEAVLVHVQANVLITATGREELRDILSVICTREAFARINWDKVDASDLVESLTHRMKVTRGKGFVPIERLGNTVESR